jgi:ATP-binding protein involved in chromosome partitioning
MRKIAVMSGKGGVGKSSVAALLGAILAEKGRTLLLDFDICGPSIATALQAKGEVYKAEKGLKPVVVTESLHVLSMGLLIKETDSVIWRGPKKRATLSMFYESIDGYDYVVIDTPPGLSDEHVFLLEKNISSIVVTTPQNISLGDAARAINFCVVNGMEVLGVVENMSGYLCECCGKVTNIFGSRGGEMLSDELGVPFICRLPIEPPLNEALDSGSFPDGYRELSSYRVLASQGLISTM